jgi:hypothetical protein
MQGPAQPQVVDLNAQVEGFGKITALSYINAHAIGTADLPASHADFGGVPHTPGRDG